MIRPTIPVSVPGCQAPVRGKKILLSSSGGEEDSGFEN
jgi:hypothetical protein